MAVHLERRGLTSLGRLQSSNDVEVLCLQENQLQDFYGMPTFPHLKFMHLDNNRISSFLGMSHQPQLEILTAEGNPICSHPHFRLMALLACGESLRIINYRIVSEDERSLCAALGGSGGWAARCICFGWTAVELKEKTDSEYEVLFRSLKDRYLARGRSLEPSYLPRDDDPVNYADTSGTPHQLHRSVTQLTPDTFVQATRGQRRSSRSSTTEPRDSYSAVEAAREYVEAYRKNGTIRGAKVKSIEPVATTFASGSSGENLALKLRQNEVGCLGGIQLQNVEVSIEDEGVTKISDAELRVIGSTAQLEIFEHHVLMFQTSLLAVDDIDLDRSTAKITILGARNEEAPSTTKPSKITLCSRQGSLSSMIGIFKVLMLFKCTPSQLDRFYSQPNL